MLGEHPVGVVLLTQDMAASRRFYAEALGLDGKAGPVIGSP